MFTRLPPFIAAMVLLAVGPASGQARDTICLHAASEVCHDMLVRHNANEPRLRQIGDPDTQRVCRSILSAQFNRDCAQKFLETKPADRWCHRYLKRAERTYARDLRGPRFAKVNRRHCS